ncbi:T-complex protein 1 subunit delta, partial [Bonamia ostreae]
LVELSKAQDIEAGDGTTTVVVLAGALLEESQKLIEKGIHPNLISESLRRCAERVPLILEKISSPVSIDDDKSLTDVAITSLSSKIVSPESKLLAPIAVKAIKQAKDNDGNVDLKNIRVTAKIGGTIEDSKLIDGLVFDQSASRSAGGPTLIRNAKIGLIQFQLSAPK